MAKKKSGLGTDAFFDETPQQQQATSPPKPEPEKPKKMRTTVMLSTEAVILLNRLKEQSIIEGNRQTQGDIIEDAIKTLAKLKDINT